MARRQFYGICEGGPELLFHIRSRQPRFPPAAYPHEVFPPWDCGEVSGEARGEHFPPTRSSDEHLRCYDAHLASNARLFERGHFVLCCCGYGRCWIQEAVHLHSLRNVDAAKLTHDNSSMRPKPSILGLVSLLLEMSVISLSQFGKGQPCEKAQIRAFSIDTNILS